VVAEHRRGVEAWRIDAAGDRFSRETRGLAEIGITPDGVPFLKPNAIKDLCGSAVELLEMRGQPPPRETTARRGASASTRARSGSRGVQKLPATR
jgi:hypothetical protein